MSTINTVNMTNPYNILDDVLLVYIDSEIDGYNLPSIIELTGDYTFSVWHKSESECTITFILFGEEYIVESKNVWQKFSKTIKVKDLTNKDILIRPTVNVNTYFYETFLSEGTLDLSWYPAPEDIDSKYSKILVELDRILLEVYDPDVGKSKIQQTADEIMTEVKGKVGNNEVISRINQSAETIQIMANKINLVGAVSASSIQANAITADKFRANETITKKLNATNLHVSGNSTFDGVITARKGGTIGGWEIDDNRILSVYEDEEDGITKYTKLQNGKWGHAIAVGGTNKEDATDSLFYVTHQGKMHAEKGDIAGWTIESGRMYSQGSDGKYTKIQSTNGWTHAFIAGAPNKNNSEGAAFYVTHAGKLYANNAEITGRINAEALTVITDQTKITVEDGIRIVNTSEDVSCSLTVKDVYGGSRCSVFSDGLSTNFGSFWTNQSDWTSNLKIIAPGFESTKYLSVGTRIFLPNGRGIRGMLSGKEFDSVSAMDNSTVIAYVDENNRTILGSHGNSYATEVRSPYAIFLKCNGYTSDENRYTLKVTYGTTAEGEGRGYLMPTYNTSGGTSYTNLGSENCRWRNVYATNATIQTSDRNYKKDIESLSDKYINMFDLLEPVSYKMVEGDRTHIGFIAQDVEEAMYQVGLTSMDFAGLCKDKLVDNDGVAVIDENGNEKEYYSLRYGEFIPINTAKIKQLGKQLKCCVQEINNQKELLEQQQCVIDELRTKCSILEQTINQ